MAIDTRDKRGSVLGLGLAALLVLPAPGTIDQPDRQQLAYAYRGLQASAPSSATPSTVDAIGEARRTLTLVGERRATLRRFGEAHSTLATVGEYE